MSGPHLQFTVEILESDLVKPDVPQQKLLKSQWEEFKTELIAGGYTIHEQVDPVTFNHTAICIRDAGKGRF